MNTTTVDAREPTIPLPTGRIVVTGAVAAAATVAAWASVAALLGRGDRIVAGAAGAALVLAVTVLSLLALRPWRSRAIGDWANLWLAAIVGRLLLTPGLAYLLYSATPLGLNPLMLSVAATYLVVQLAEAAALAVHLKRTT